jgi:hypothetical protein
MESLGQYVHQEAADDAALKPRVMTAAATIASQLSMSVFPGGRTIQRL